MGGTSSREPTRWELYVSQFSMADTSVPQPYTQSETSPVVSSTSCDRLCGCFSIPKSRKEDY